jgi:hypothetical protein
VHFDLPWNPAVFEQRVGRVWRLGQTAKVDVWSLVGEDCLESRIADVLAGKHAAFTAVFDGTSDAAMFERQPGFLAAARRVAGTEAEADAPGGAAKAVDDDDAVIGEDVVAAPVVESPVEHLAVAEPTPAGGVARAARAAPAVPPLSAPQLQNLLAGLTVTPRADGGLVLNADRESAGVLARLLRSLAAAIEGGVAGSGGP